MTMYYFWAPMTQIDGPRYSDDPQVIWQRAGSEQEAREIIEENNRIAIDKLTLLVECPEDPQPDEGLMASKVLSLSKEHWKRVHGG